MKKSVLLTLMAVLAVTIFAFACRKQENVNTDTAAVDTGVTSSSTSGTTATDTATTAPPASTSTTATTATTTAPATDTATTATSGTTGTGTGKKDKHKLQF